MSIFSRLFPEKKIAPNKISVYLNADFKQSIEVDDQQVGQYLEQEGTADSKEFIFLLVKNKKGNILLKRKLNKYEKFSEALAEVDPECKGFFIMGYTSHFKGDPEKPIPIMTNVQSEGAKIIRSGILYKFSHKVNGFEECQFKLHQDYLMYTKISKKDKLILVPLQNSNVQIVDNAKHIFVINDKFKTIKLKSLSKEDMYGWLSSITEAIKLKNQQRYANSLVNKIVKHQQDKVRVYGQQAKNLLQNDKGMLTDEKGRKALRDYFQKQTNREELALDIKILAIINKYYHYCRLLRDQDGEAMEVFKALRVDLVEMQHELKEIITMQKSQHLGELPNNELYKVFEVLATKLSQKYHPILLANKYLHTSILRSAVQNYRDNNRMHLSSFLNKTQRN